MAIPKLSQLQARFAASFVASAILLLLLYLAAGKPQFAYAAEIDTRTWQHDAQPFMIDHPSDQETAHRTSHILQHVEKRQASTQRSLQNNAPQNLGITIGQTQHWIFPQAEVQGPHGETGRGLPTGKTKTDKMQTDHFELRKRQTQRKIYVSLNTCSQPRANTSSTANTAPPQLLMYVSTDPSNQNPGPGLTGNQDQIVVTGGYALAENLTTDQSVYIGIAAPNTTSYAGQWNYEIAASIDAPYHSFEGSSPNLHFVDGDNHAALLITDTLTDADENSTVYQEWMSIKPPYGMFAHNQIDQTILGVERSYCGLRENTVVKDNLDTVANLNTASMTNRGLDKQPKEQFYINALNASSTYFGYLAMEGNSTDSGLGVVGGGGKVWSATFFKTKAESNCALMYNLTFCSEVAYAVPSNPKIFPAQGGLPALAAIYDSYASQMYQYFNYSLQQIPCDTDPSAQYSLARTCDDCAAAYKTWLCAVTIPRCEDYGSNASYLAVRNLGQAFPNGSSIAASQGLNQQLLSAVASNSSRSTIIDEQIQPGPYKEVLPCDYLCYDLVRSCPAALGFDCPRPGAGLESSYGSRSRNGSEITCSYLGAAYYQGAAAVTAPVSRLSAVLGWVLVVTAVIGFV